MVETLELVADDLLAIGLGEVELECLLPELGRLGVGEGVCLDRSGSRHSRRGKGLW